MRKMLQGHKIAFFTAFLVGVIAVLPQLFFMVSGEGFAGSHLFGADAEHHYVARIREVYDGHAALGNVFLPDKNLPYVQPSLGEIIVALVGKMLHMSAPDVNVFTKFLFPFSNFLAVYFFVHALFSSKKVSFLAASVVLLGLNLMSGVGPLTGLFSAATATNDFLVFTRPVVPQVSSLFLFLSLYLLFQATCNTQKAKKKFALFCGLVSGLTIYVYGYVWSFLAVLAVLYLLYFLLLKDGAKIKNFCYAISLHLFVTMPYWFNFMKVRVHEDYADTVIRLGLIDSHAFIVSTWLLISFAITLVFWPREYQRSQKFILLSIGALFIALNQQILSGKMLQTAHYHWYITQPIAGIVLAAMLVYILRKFFGEKRTAIALIGAVIILFYNAGLIQTHSYNVRYREAVYNQRYAKVLSYLEHTYSTARHVWASPQLAALVPVYTKHDSLNVHHAQFYLNGKDYFFKKLFLTYRLRGVEPKDIYSIMREERSAIASEVFGIYYREKYGDDARIPDSILEELAAQYSAFYQVSYGEIFANLSIDLIVWDTLVESQLNYESIGILQKIYEIPDEFVIYKVRRTT